MPRTETFQPDYDRITAAILQLDVKPLAKETGSTLVDAWLERWSARDSQDRVEAVECGFVMWLDEETAVIGVSDLTQSDEKGVFGSEWKSTKAPSEWWTEDKWLDSIKRGSQVGVYGLALREATYYERGHVEGKIFRVARPRIRVRACVKTPVPKFWPVEEEEGMFTFEERDLQSVRNALLNKAATLRMLRKRESLPWQLPGIQCTPFKRECEFLELCTKKDHPPSGTRVFDPSDPAAQLSLVHIGAEKLANPDLVVLSASSYATASECAEKYRIISGAQGEGEETREMQIGTVLHCGIASMYKQIREWQQSA